ncbi:MAG: hypothetical protein ABWY12_12335 [Burkholderiales bacterium]
MGTAEFLAASLQGRRYPVRVGPEAPRHRAQWGYIAMVTNEQPAPKFSIYSVEGPKIEVTAMYNPKELQVDKSVPWAKSPKSKADQPDLEFTSAEGRSMSFELMFDTYETGKNVHTEFVDNLIKLTLVQDLKRPPKVGVTWGSGKLPEFQGVIESLSTKYTMFLPDGTPVRATCHVKIKEASSVAVKKSRATTGSS